MQQVKQSIYLVDGKTHELVEAQMTRFQSPERLIQIEASWNRLRDWSARVNHKGPSVWMGGLVLPN